MTTNNSTKSTIAEIMNILVDEGDIDRDLADTVIALKEGRARVVPTTDTTTVPSVSVRPFVADSEWAGLTDEQRAKLNGAFMLNDSDTIIDFIGEGLSKDTAKLVRAEAQKAADLSAKRREESLSCVGGFSYNPKRKAYYAQVRIDGPAPKGFSEPRHRAISVHQVAITAALCQQIGPDAVMAACRDALECVKVAKENKITVGGFGAESTDD